MATLFIFVVIQIERETVMPSGKPILWFLILKDICIMFSYYTYMYYIRNTVHPQLYHGSVMSRKGFQANPKGFKVRIIHKLFFNYLRYDIFTYMISTSITYFFNLYCFLFLDAPSQIDLQIILFIHSVCGLLTPSLYPFFRLGSITTSTFHTHLETWWKLQLFFLKIGGYLILVIH